MSGSRRPSVRLTTAPRLGASTPAGKQVAGHHVILGLEVDRAKLGLVGQAPQESSPLSMTDAMFFQPRAQPDAVGGRGDGGAGAEGRRRPSCPGNIGRELLGVPGVGLGDAARQPDDDDRVGGRFGLRGGRFSGVGGPARRAGLPSRRRGPSGAGGGASGVRFRSRIVCFLGEPAQREAFRRLRQTTTAATKSSTSNAIKPAA